MSGEAMQRRAVVWSQRSKRDLASIRAYIGQHAPLAAQRFTLKLVNAVESLADLAERGRPVQGSIRELVVIAPYVVRYRVRAGVVDIVRIKHGAQRPDGWL
jgi:addiction module RelE/StbE family toxin